jgi:hypothetical protein
MLSRQEIATVLRKMKKIKHTQKPYIDGRMLWCVANLVFFAGVKKNEIAWLKIRDVFNGNSITDRIFQCGRRLKKPIQISNEVMRILSGYIQYLRQNGARVLDPDSALFPDYSGKSGGRNLSRHLEDYKTSFNDLRKTGINHYYQDLLRDGNDGNIALKGTASHFRMEERSVRNLVIKGTPSPAGRKKEEKQVLSERILHFFAEAQRLTDHEILVEDKARKLLTGFYDLVDSKPDLSKDATLWKGFFVRHTIECVHSNKVISKKFGTVNVQKVKKGLPKNQEVDALRNTLLAYIEKIKETLGEQEKLDLVNRKRAFDELRERRKTGMKELAEDKEHRIFPKPSIEEIGEKLNQLRKEAKVEKKLRTKKGEVRVSPGIIKKYFEDRKKRELNPPVPRTYGVIKKVDTQANSITIVTKTGIWTKREKTFIVENTTRITKGIKEILLSDLKPRMNVSIEEYQGVAKAINVYTPKGSGKGKKKIVQKLKTAK